MTQVRKICFQTRGGVNHDFGGLDRVTELLADYFEDNHHKVYYLSQLKRPGTDNPRQVYLPNEKELVCEENINFYNKFLKEEQIDVLINQEGNVNIILPYQELKRNFIYITVLHFNPQYITEDHFEHRISKLGIPNLGKAILQKVLSLKFVKKTALSILYKKLERNYFINCSNADAFVLLSYRFKKDFEKLFTSVDCPKNIYAINNPIKLDSIPLDFHKKKKKILYVGKLECVIKRVDTLLDNWAKIARNFPDWSFHLVGGGPDEMMLKQKVRDENIPGVFFEGIQDPKPYYIESSIFCFASSYEGWGMVLVEAQMYGCVPIAFDSYSAVRDIITDGVSGRLISPFDDIAYAEALAALMQSIQLRHDMAKKCIESVKKFDVDYIGGQWENLFKVVGEKVIEIN